MERVKKVTLIYVVVNVLLILAHVLTLHFGTIVDFLFKVHDSWGALVDTFGMLLFSVVNIGIWLYQSRLSTKAMKRQVILQEQLKLLTELQSKLLFVTKYHSSYEEFKKIYWDAYSELERWFYGIYAHIFKNDTRLISFAFSAMGAISEAWHKHHSLEVKYVEERSTDISFSEYYKSYFDFRDELFELEKPLLEVIKYYRAQVDPSSRPSILTRIVDGTSSQTRHVGKKVSKK